MMTLGRPFQTRTSRLVSVCALSLLAAAPLMADVLPADLPFPDTRPIAKDKPVKVYILSGQSNMLGFGRIDGSTPYYASVIVSPDPAVKPCVMPETKSALMPMGVYLTKNPKDVGATATVYRGLFKADEDFSAKRPALTEGIQLGKVDQQLPTLEGDCTVVVEAFIGVPYNGKYDVYPGLGSSAHCVATIDGAVVYSHDGTSAIRTPVELKKGKFYPLKIVYSQGGSAAFWMEKTDMEGMGDLRWAVEKLGRFPYLLDEKGEWTVCKDVMLNDAYMGKGKSDPLSAPACGSTFGPELGFGYVMGAYHDEPVIVMKADIGNRSLGWDILPPGSESYTYDGKNYPGYGMALDADGNVVKPKEGGWYAGKQYDDYTAAVRKVLDNFGEKYPEYADQGFEVAGFVWWQGHKDGPNPGHNKNYEKNLANLIKAWRKEFNAPKAKWAIATVGFDGEDMPEHYHQIAAAQRAVADPKKHPEFAGTVKTIETIPFWRDAAQSPKAQNYHYNHNGETYMLTGDALGRAMVELYGGKVEYPAAKVEKDITIIPKFDKLASEEIAAMSTSLSPIILNKLLPEYIDSSSKIPAYRRKGLFLANLVSNKGEEKPRHPEQLTSQLDQVINYYNVAGIHEYDWRKFGAEMQKAKWDYFSFDPASPIPIDAKGRVGDMYREVKLPAGMDNWAATDFDAKKAGWKTGTSPFGQKEGEKVALIESCKVSYCGCSIVPNTLWEKEVIMLRQTFDAPDFKEGHRYRMVVGGAGHTWSGEGFALYIDGKQVCEADGGYYKGGGQARGAYIFDDLVPAFEDGKVTVAVKAFLRQTGHRGKMGPKRGHISVWLEEAKLPQSVLKIPQDEEEPKK